MVRAAASVVLAFAVTAAGGLLLTRVPATTQASTSTEEPDDTETTSPINEGELAVKFAGAFPTGAWRASFASAQGLEETGVSAEIGWATFHITDGTPTLTKVAALQNQPGVLAAEPDLLGEWATFPQTPPNDTYYPNQWGLEGTNMLNAWQIAGGGAGNRMFVVMDTGVQGGMNANGNWTPQHPDLGYIDGRNFTLPYVNGQPQRRWFNDDDDCAGHGTGVAGVGAAFTNNSRGIAGVAYNAPIWSLRVTGSGCPNPSMHAAAKAVNWEVNNNAYVITAAFTHVAEEGQHQHFKDAVTRAYNNGVMVVAASGNQNKNFFTNRIPARWETVITVGGTNVTDHRCKWEYEPEFWVGANYGNPGLDVSAPCLSIRTTALRGGYIWGIRESSGTSLAVPLVAGVVFLLKSRHPSWTGAQIKSRIDNTADKVGGFDYGWRPDVCGGQSRELGCGLIDPDGAVQ